MTPEKAYRKVEIVEPDTLAAGGHADVEVAAVAELRRRAGNMGHVLGPVIVTWSADRRWCTASAQGRLVSPEDFEVER